MAELSSLEELAPLHNVPAVHEIERMRRELPGLPQVGVFDTAFHAHLDATAAAYAVPEQWREEWGFRRYGFHGLSVQWSTERATELLGKEHPRDLHLVVCHLGGGSSVTAVHEGRSADTTMGFSPLEGLPMTTRSGSIDPAIVLSILRRKLLTLEELDDALHRHSGLAGLSGRSGDLRELESLAADDPQALFALELYAHRVAAAIAAMGTSLGRIDAIVFTGGIGEHSFQTRARVCERLKTLGVLLDEQTNVHAEPDCSVNAKPSAVDVLVIAAREEIVIARSARALLARG
jgi:acetate kinase